MKTAVVNIGAILTGDWRSPTVAGDSILTEGDKIVAVGTLSSKQVDGADVVIDAGGTIAIPGLIDSQVHVTFGDYTPRQQTIGFLESYLHGGTTRVLSASEVHVPGRPTDVVGVKALAIAAFKSYEHYRPSGMTVHGGSVILEPGLTRADFDELHAAGVRMAKGGFGGFADGRDYIPVVADARAAGITVMCHSGGGSIPGSRAKTSAELLPEMRRKAPGQSTAGPPRLPPRRTSPWSHTAATWRCNSCTPATSAQPSSCRSCCWSATSSAASCSRPTHPPAPG